MSTANIIDRGFSCLVEKLDVVDAERFIALIKRDDFDYTVWQREYFDSMESGQIMEEASAYAKSHPHNGQGKCI